MKNRIAYITGSRADYGIVRRYLSLLAKDKNIDLQILVTGSWLDKKYGSQYHFIVEDGFKIGYKCKIPIKENKITDTLSSMSIILNKFGAFFEKNKYDLIIILGDRYEIFPVAIAAAMHNLKILHIHGGEATYANYDEFIRHSITKMSTYHFTSTEKYSCRVLQLGENPKNVYYLGSLGAENCLYYDKNNVIPSINKLNFKKNITVLYHPETLVSGDVKKRFMSILKALDKYKNDYQIIFIGSNADTKSNQIEKLIHSYISKNKNIMYYKNINSESFYELIKKSICLVGNSSCGLIEAPSLKTFTINIGKRQEGRIRGRTVIDCDYDSNEIINAIESIINKKLTGIFNPYYYKNSCINYYNVTKKVLSLKTDSYKKFFDYPKKK